MGRELTPGEAHKGCSPTSQVTMWNKGMKSHLRPRGFYSGPLLCHRIGSSSGDGDGLEVRQVHRGHEVLRVYTALEQGGEPRLLQHLREGAEGGEGGEGG